MHNQHICHQSGSIAAPCFQLPSQLNCQWRLMVVRRSGSWIPSLGETSDIAPLILLLELLREQSKALVQYQPPLSEAPERGLLRQPLLYRPPTSGQHLLLLNPFHRCSHMGSLLYVGFAITASVNIFTHCGWFQAGHRHDYKPSV